MRRAEQLGHGLFVQLRADHADAARDHRTAVADIRLTGDIVEVDPLFALRVCYIALCAQNNAVGIRVLKRLQDALDLGLCEFLVRFLAPADEDLVGVMAQSGSSHSSSSSSSW